MLDRDLAELYVQVVFSARRNFGARNGQVYLEPLPQDGGRRGFCSQAFGNSAERGCRI